MAITSNVPVELAMPAEATAAGAAIGQPCGRVAFEAFEQNIDRARSVSVFEELERDHDGFALRHAPPPSAVLSSKRW